MLFHLVSPFTRLPYQTSMFSFSVITLSPPVLVKDLLNPRVFIKAVVLVPAGTLVAMPQQGLAGKRIAALIVIKAVDVC